MPPMSGISAQSPVMPVIGFVLPLGVHVADVRRQEKIETGIKANSRPTMPLVPLPRYARTSANVM